MNRVQTKEPFLELRGESPIGFDLREEERVSTYVRLEMQSLVDLARVEKRKKSPTPSRM